MRQKRAKSVKASLNRKKYLKLETEIYTPVNH